MEWLICIFFIAILLVWNYLPTESIDTSQDETKRKGEAKEE